MKKEHQPVNIFLYHVNISSSDTPSILRYFSFSTSTPSESITRYVGIPGPSSGLIKPISVVNLLFIAPGKRTLSLNNDQFMVFLLRSGGVGEISVGNVPI